MAKTPLAIPWTETDVRNRSARLKESKNLLESRLKSWAAYSHLPVETSELFKKYADFSEIAWNTFELDQLAQGNLTTQVPQEMASHNADVLFVDGRLAAVGAQRKGLFFSEIGQALSKDADTWLPLLEQAHRRNPDKFSSLAMAAFESGYAIEVHKDHRESKPLRIVHWNTGKTASLIAANVVIAQPGSELTILEETYSTGATSTLEISHTFLAIQEQAVIRHSRIHAPHAQTTSFQSKQAVVGKDARIEWDAGYFGGGLTHAKTESFLEGTGATAVDAQIALGDGRQRFHLTSDLFHRERNTRAKVSCRMVLQDHARGLFKGVIDIPLPATQTQAFLTSHAILLSPTAAADAIPALKIENNEVKATHSASVAQLDENQMFYLMARGFDRAQARQTIVRGFVEPLLRQIQLPAVKAQLEKMIVEKLEGKPLRMELSQSSDSNRKDEQNSPAGELFERHYKYR